MNTIVLISLFLMVTMAKETTPIICRHQKGSSLLVKVPKASAFCEELAKPWRTCYQPLDVLRPNTQSMEVNALYCLRTRTPVNYYTDVVLDAFADDE